MTTKLIVILGISIAAVAAMFIMGRCADGNDAGAKIDKQKTDATKA